MPTELGTVDAHRSWSQKLSTLLINDDRVELEKISFQDCGSVFCILGLTFQRIFVAWIDVNRRESTLAALERCRGSGLQGWFGDARDPLR